MKNWQFIVLCLLIVCGFIGNIIILLSLNGNIDNLGFQLHCMHEQNKNPYAYGGNSCWK